MKRSMTLYEFMAQLNRNQEGSPVPQIGETVQFETGERFWTVIKVTDRYVLMEAQ